MAIIINYVNNSSNHNNRNNNHHSNRDDNRNNNNNSLHGIRKSCCGFSGMKNKFGSKVLP